MTVFADTAALYALLVRTEDGHGAVAETFSGLLGAGRALVTSNYVLLETTALLQRRIGLPAVRDFGERIVPLLDCRWVTEPVHRRGVERLTRTDRRHVSLVDCTSFVLMDDEGIHDAFTLDADFSGEGFRILPG